MANQSKRKPSHGAGKKKAAKKNLSNQVRIVAGKWRGRKIPVLDADGLRPTGDRVRETLFNWLQLDIPGRDCLDLFAGTGALGLEAASRGAASVCLVESAAPVAEQLRRTLAVLDAPDSVSIYSGTAQNFLDDSTTMFDVVFVDPPFGEHLHKEVIERLVEGSLRPDALVYVECPSSERELVDALPDALELVKEKQFGDVSAFLFRKA